MKADAYHGPLGKIVRIVEEDTEADPAGILAQALVGFGSLIGGGPYFKVEETRHHAKEFLVLVGRTASGRKGTGWNRARAPLSTIDEVWATERIKGGLSSGEGLIYEVRDPKEETSRERESAEDARERIGDAYDKLTAAEKQKAREFKMVTHVVDAGCEDKRLLVVEPEYARVLKVAQRDGNTLSTIVRDAWDQQLLNVMTKTAMKATGTHISIIGHITREELLRLLEDTEAASGFANRFIFLAVQRARLLPDGGSLDPQALAGPIGALRRAVSIARIIGPMRRDDEARELWHQEYGRLSSGKPGLLGAMLSRAEAHVLRLSMIYALADGSGTITRPHLQAALAVWDYAERSARFIFGDRLGEPTADELRNALRDAGRDGMSRNDMREHFQHNKKSAEITRALEVLARNGLAVQCEKQKEGPGRPEERWRSREGGE